MNIIKAIKSARKVYWEKNDERKRQYNNDDNDNIEHMAASNEYPIRKNEVFDWLSKSFLWWYNASIY